MILTVPIFLFLISLHRQAEHCNAFSVHSFARTSLPLSRSSSLSNNAAPLSGSKAVASRTLRSRTSLSMSGEGTNPYYVGQDSYQILGVPRSADIKQIKSAYRKLVSAWHPDKFPDDEAKKKEGGLRLEKINRAYYTIGDEDRKRRYDQYGEAGVGTSAASEEQLKEAGGPGMMGGGFGGSTVDVGDISDIFDSFFGGGGGGRARQPRNANAPVAGDDLQVEVEIPFMTAIFGGQQKINVRRLEQCGTCGGNGIKPGAKSKTCSSCAGKGVVNNMQRTPFGVFNNVQTCPTCRGSGQEIEEYCPTCRGKGSVAETKEVSIRIPAGIDAGTSLRVKDSGNAGKRGGPRGDLFVEIRIKRDPKFKRDGIDIYTEEEISYYDAILGTSVSADTVDGKTEVKIPAGTQPDQKLRLRGKGATKLGTDFRGDQYITVKVKIPQNVSGKEKELIESISKLNSGDKKGGFPFGFGGN